MFTQTKRGYRPPARPAKKGTGFSYNPEQVKDTSIHQPSTKILSNPKTMKIYSPYIIAATVSEKLSI